jgi:hypothetical protein
MCLCESRLSYHERFGRECGVPPRRLEPHPWLPGGCVRQTWRGRACLRNGSGPRMPSRAQGLAAGQPSCTDGHRDALEPLGDLRPSSLSPRKMPVCKSRASSRAGPCRWKHRARHLVVPAASRSSPATGWTRRAPCAGPRARVHARPVHPSAVPRPNFWPTKSSSRSARAGHLGVAPRRALAGDAKSGAGMRNVTAGSVGLFPEHLAEDAGEVKVLKPNRAASKVWAHSSPADH